MDRVPANPAMHTSEVDVRRLSVRSLTQCDKHVL